MFDMRSRRPAITSRPRRVRRRNSRRIDRPTLRQAIHDANMRARQRTNTRIGRRHGLTSIQAAIAGTASEPIIHLNIGQRMTRWLIALLLLPFCVVTTRALFNINQAPGVEASFWYNLLTSEHFLFFGIGGILMTGWFFTGLLERLFLYFYVLGHELTHALFVYVCGGKVGGIRVTADGGYVMTNKSNFLIALSPYFLPFWSIVIVALSSVLGFFYRDIPHHDNALYCLIGFSWTFHLLWTLWMITREQPDLKENGIFFSLVVIYLANVIAISILLCLGPGNLTWYHWANEFMDAWQDLTKFVNKSGVLGI